MKNIEGYQDPTPGAAFGNIRREEHKREADRLSVISNLIQIMKQTAELAGFDFLFQRIHAQFNVTSRTPSTPNTTVNPPAAV